MTVLTPVVVEETIQATGGDFATINLWEAGAPQVLTREVSGQTCSATAADSGHIVLHAGADATDDFYNGLVVEWSGEQRRITDYVGSTKTAAVGALNGGAATFTGTPQNTDAFTIYPVIRKGLLAAENFNALATIAGQTTDADAYMWLTTQANASWRDTATPATEQVDWDGAKARIDHSPGTTNQILLTVSAGNTIVQGLQIRAGAQQRVTQVVAFAGGAVFRDCMVVDSTSNQQRRNMFRTSQTVVNCVFWWNSTLSDAVEVLEASAGALFVNCSVLRSTNQANALVAIVQRLGNCAFRSCAFYGDWGGFQTSSTGTIEVDKCATNIASFGTISSGSGNITSGNIAADMEDLVDEFGDGRARAAGNLDGGADVETETDYGSGAVDVYGQARSVTTPWIGAFEIEAAGGPAAIIDIALSAQTVAENSAGATIGTITSTNGDDTYTLISDPTGQLEISGAILRLIAGQSLDRETDGPTFSITIRASNTGVSDYDEAFVITVSDVQEPPTGVTLTSTNVPDGSASGTTVGLLGAVDPDVGDTFVFALVAGTGDTDNASFSVVGNELRTGFIADKATKETYGVRLQATDQGGAGTAVAQPFTITVTALGIGGGMVRGVMGGVVQPTVELA